MSKGLKGFQKLFFIIFFIFSNLIIFSNQKTFDFSDKIAPELEKIEALPRRTKPAELNIEVTKMKSEPLKEIYIDRKNKNIYVDFSQKREQALKGIKNVEELEKKYSLSVSESIESSGEVVGKTKNRIGKSIQTIPYEVSDLNGKKMLKIPYENEPEKLYITVKEDNTSSIAKIYSLNLKESNTVEPTASIIEEKVVVINLSKDINEYLNKTLTFNSDGSLSYTGIDNESGNATNINSNEVEIIKQSGFPGIDRFINSFSTRTTIAIAYANFSTTATKPKGESQELQLNINTPNHEVFVFKYYKNGELGLRFQQLNQGLKSYTFNITHTSGSLIKKHTLVINGGKISKKEATVKYLNGYDGVETTFDFNGLPSRTGIEVTKNNFTESFINGLGYTSGTFITVQQIDINGNSIGSSVSAGRALGSNATVNLGMPDIDISFLGNEGQLRIKMKTMDNTKSYRYKITHRNSNDPKGTIVREDILNINAAIVPLRKLMDRTSSLNDIIIEDMESLTSGIEYSFGTLGIEQIGNGSDLIDKTNPFPTLALGKQGVVNSQDGWSFQKNETSFQTRNIVETTYKSDSIAETIPMQMYFADTITQITNPGGGTAILLKKGNPETVLSAFGDAKREKMETKLKGKINSVSTLNSLLNKFRGLNSYEISLNSLSDSKEQISYVVGQRTEGGMYSAPSISDLNASLVSDKKIEYLNYPKIILKKPRISENLSMTLSEAFNLDKAIIFGLSGVNMSGLNLSSDTKKYLKSLHFESTFKINDESSGRAIDSSGTSQVNEITLTNGTNEIKLSLEYKNGYPTLKILNYPKAGTYSLNIKHYEPSGLERLNYTLNIIVEKDFELPDPRMVRVNDMKEFVIEDDIESETYKVVNDDLGTILMQQTRLVNHKEFFPFLALGDRDGVKGWKFTDITNPNNPREDVLATFTDGENSLPLKMFFERFASPRGVQILLGDPATAIGIFMENSLESVEVKLKAEIQKLEDIDKIISSLRGKPERFITLKPASEISKENQISYSIGEVKDGKYSAVTNGEVASGNQKIESINYPNIKIVKPLLEEKLNLEVLSNQKEVIKFNQNGVTQEGVKVTSDKNRYLKTLHYNSLFNINGGPIKSIIDGKSEPYDATLTNGENYLILRIKYVDRYPEFEILSFSNPGNYTLNIKHFDPVNGNQRLVVNALERQNYDIIFNIEAATVSPKEFEVTSSLRDIVVLAPTDGNPLNAKVEYPDNWIKITQLVDDKTKFPVIGINRPSWVISTDRPLNPIDKIPTAILDLGTEGRIEVPVNIRETPYQNTEKFFVYDRGDMTNRNIAVGGYSPLSLSTGSALNNRVQVDFEVKLNQEHINKILTYAATQAGDRVEIPYSTKDLTGANLPSGYHNIYSIKGIQSLTSKKFKLEEINILTDETKPFPKIVVQKNNNPVINSATLNFINPVPKSTGDISGTFDVLYGVVPPNNLQGYDHPSSLSVSGVSATWPGFTIVPEYHKIRISSTTESKEFTTTEEGEMKGTQTITSGNNRYLFMKGKNTPLAIGILSWDFSNKANDKITLEHLNSSGRVVARDEYLINLEIFTPSKYLDITNSSLMNARGTNKDLTITANVRQDFIDLGTLKLQNYQKDITKTGVLDSATGLYENELKIEAYSELITLNLASNPSSTVKLKGRLKFDSEKTNVSTPNENRSLKFVLDSSNDSEAIAGNTFTITNPNGKSLISIKGGGKQDILLEKLTLTLKDGQAGVLPEMSFISTLTALTVKEESIKNNITSYKMPGQMTLRQLTGGQGNSVPAIALGDYINWNLSGGDRRYPRLNRTQIPVNYKIGNTPITVYPELFNPIDSVDGGRDINGNLIPDAQINLYAEKDNVGRVLTALTWVTNRNTRNERITTELKLNLLQNQLALILEELKNIPGDRVELKPASTVLTDSNNKAKIAYIHARDTGNSGDNSEGNKLYIPTNTTLSTKFAYESLPSIFIEKEKLFKNVEINLLLAFILGNKVIFNSSTGLQIPSGVTIIPEDNRVLEGLDYTHKIRLTLPGGIVKEYTTTSIGGTSSVITEIIEKNGKTITLNINYTSGKNVEFWVSERSGSQYFDVVIEHVDPSGDVRRTSNIRINSGIEGSTAKLGEMDFIISSRYNATEVSGQLISDPLLITSTGITYQTEVLELKLLNGDYPEAPGIDKIVEVNGISLSALSDFKITLTNGTVLKFIKENNGDLKIKPLKWNYNTTDQFTLDYKDSNNKIVNQYKFNIICPEFFVASVGELNFGKVYKVGNPSDKTVRTNIELQYNTGTVTATYSLDVSQANPNGSLLNSLYLNDAKTLLVKNLYLNDEEINSSDNSKRTLPLTGTLDANGIKNTPAGVYQKTIQILIHLK